MSDLLETPWAPGVVRWFENVRDWSHPDLTLWTHGGQRLQEIVDASNSPVALVWADEDDPICNAALATILAASAGTDLAAALRDVNVWMNRFPAALRDGDYDAVRQTVRDALYAVSLQARALPGPAARRG